MNIKVGIVVSLLALHFASSEAAIVSTAGPIKIIDAPPSVLPDALGSDTTIFGFVETTGVLLTSGLTVNGSDPGIYIPVADPPFPVYPVIPAWTRVNSYLFHADPTTPNLEFGRDYDGSVTFDTEILGIIFGFDLLIASDAIIGSPTTVYSTDSPRQFEAGLVCGFDTADCAVISPDRRTVIFFMSTTTQTDQIRIVTKIPEPSTMAMLILALGFLAVGSTKAGRSRSA